MNLFLFLLKKKVGKNTALISSCDFLSEFQYGGRCMYAFIYQCTYDHFSSFETSFFMIVRDLEALQCQLSAFVNGCWLSLARSND